MHELTKRQQQIVDFIQRRQQTSGLTPSFQDIAEHFGFRSPTTVADHLRLIRQKGALASEPGRARSLRVLSPWQAFKKPVVDIPIFGSIPAGFADERSQEAVGCISVDVEAVGIKPTARTFALEVHGDSMIGKHILSGDFVVIEHGLTPKPGDVVAALIDGESTLKTFNVQRGKPFLHAENPKYPDLIPATELVIQGVMVALIRKRK
jgi:repressor LexA